MTQQLNVRRLALFALSLALLLAGVLLTSQPAQAGLSQPTIKFKGDDVVLKFEHTGSAVLHRVYIEADRYTHSGYQSPFMFTGDYMAEGDQLYIFAGATQTEWAWTPIVTVTYKVNGDRIKWRFDTSLLLLSCERTMGYTFQIEKASGKLKNTPMKYVFDPGCAGGPSISPSQTSTATSTLTATASVPTPTYTPTLTPTPRIPVAGGRSLIVPAYYYIAYDGEVGCQGTEPDCEYVPLLQPPASYRTIVILNPSSDLADFQRGEPIPGYQRHIAAFRSANIPVFLYISTNYAQRPLAEVKAEAANFVDWYPYVGLFFDELSNDCADLDYYNDLIAYLYGLWWFPYTIGNPGTNVPECYANLMDVLITYEGGHAEYASWVAEPWTSNFASSRFAHLVHSAPQADLSDLLEIWGARNVGLIYVTDSTLADNPWDELPTYWPELVDAVTP